MKHLLLIIALAFTFCFSAAAQTELRVGSQAPQFSVTALDGNAYDLSKMHGQVVVVTFWSVRCLICQSELPRVNQLIKGYQGKDVTFLAITPDDDVRVKQYLEFSPQEAHVVTNSFGTLLAYADKDKEGRMNFGYPAFYVIDREGRIAYRGSGWDRTAQLNAAISGLSQH
jgi:peroxiredoxin